MGALPVSPGLRAVLLFALAFASVHAVACEVTPEVTEIGTPGWMHISYAAGLKLKESAWSPGEDETIFGFVDADRRCERIPAWLVGKLLVGTADAPATVEDPDADSAGTAELCVGLRKYAAFGRAELFASAGLALLTAGITGYHEETSDAFSIDDEVSLGGWLDAGIQMPITPSFIAGLVVHHSVGSDVELEGAELQPGGTSILFTLGWRH